MTDSMKAANIRDKSAGANANRLPAAGGGDKRRKITKEKKRSIRRIEITVPSTGMPNVVIELEKQMRDAADNLDFERAIALRDQVKKLTERLKHGGKHPRSRLKNLS